MNKEEDVAKHRSVNRWLVPLSLALGIGGVTLLHFRTSTEHVLLHQIYQRLYYIPIIYAGYRYGVLGALIASISSAVLYAPHIFLQWEHRYIYMLNQNVELIMFQVIALVTGLLADAEKREHRRYERAARELREAYDELKRAYDHLIRADRLASLGEVSAGIVHEIRTPLASIKGAVEILESPTTSASAKAEFCQIIRREVDRLNRLVEEFLQFARPRRPERLPTDMNEIVRAVILLCRKQATEQRVTIETHLQDPLPSVLIDPEQMKQVLLNIVINGIQAMPDGGLLELTTRQSDGVVEVTIRDHGPGIDEFHLKKVFDPFFTTKQNGTGLGLSIAYRLAKQNGGDIDVFNAPDGGCAFKLVLPLHNREPNRDVSHEKETYSLGR